jgi:hypothetical protein
MPKQIGIAMVVLAAVLLTVSVISLRYPDFSQWFPFLLVIGGAFGWFGFKRIRWA